MGMTTNAIVNAIEWDLENAPKSTTATTVNQRSILEKHVGPLVEGSLSWKVRFITLTIRIIRAYSRRNAMPIKQS